MFYTKLINGNTIEAFMQNSARLLNKKRYKPLLLHARLKRGKIEESERGKFNSEQNNAENRSPCLVFVI